MKALYYKLDENHQPVPAVEEGSATRNEQLVAWAEWWEQNRFMADVTLPTGVRVATIFLGLDASAGFGRSEFFETTVFGVDRKMKDQRRYRTYDDAMTGHAELVRKYRGH